MQYNPTLFCQYLSCRLLPSCSADPVQREGGRNVIIIIFFFRAGELEAARQHGARRKRLLCPSQGAGEGKRRKMKQPGCCSPVPQRHLQAPRRQTRVFGPGVTGVLLASSRHRGEVSAHADAPRGLGQEPSPSPVPEKSQILSLYRAGRQQGLRGGWKQSLVTPKSCARSRGGISWGCAELEAAAFAISPWLPVPSCTHPCPLALSLAGKADINVHPRCFGVS